MRFSFLSFAVLQGKEGIDFTYVMLDFTYLIKGSRRLHNDCRN